MKKLNGGPGIRFKKGGALVRLAVLVHFEVAIEKRIFATTDTSLMTIFYYYFEKILYSPFGQVLQLRLQINLYDAI